MVSVYPVIRRVGFRRVLPLLFTLVHVSLLVYSHQRQPYRSSGSVHNKYRLVVYQEEQTPKWEPIEPKPLTTAQKVSLLLNLPSLFLAIPFAAILHHETDIGMLCVAVPFVPITWYGIGRWIDGMLGFVMKRWGLPRSLSGFVAFLATGLIVLSACGVTPINHHRQPDTYWTGTALILWSGLFLAMSLSSFYHRPRQLS
jgi:hypothetical protein